MVYPFLCTESHLNTCLKFGVHFNLELESPQFTGHFDLLEQSGGLPFARPFTSWERGSNENFNGLLRQYVPKKRAMNTVDEEEIIMIQNRLNNRPRKRLGFKTP